MHIITQTRIWAAKLLYPDSAHALDAWYRVMKRNTFNNFAELKRVFNSVDKVREVIVFDIGGNKLRLVAYIHFQRKKVYIRHILTHKAYDKSNWR